MYKLICQKPAHFLPAQIAVLSSFLEMILVLEMYNFGQDMNCNFQFRILHMAMLWKKDRKSLSEINAYQVLQTMQFSHFLMTIQSWKSQKEGLFFSLTKNQILNTKCQLKFFVVVSIRSSSLIKLKWQPKNFGWHLVFSIWFLVTNRSNEKNIDLSKIFFKLQAALFLFLTASYRSRRSKVCHRHHFINTPFPPRTKNSVMQGASGCFKNIS